MKTRSTKKTVGCRLEEEYRSALAEEALERGVDVADVIRKYIIDGLREDATKGSLFEHLAFILKELRETRRDHSLMAEVLLSAAGKCDGEKAREWAEANIKAD